MKLCGRRIHNSRLPIHNMWRVVHVAIHSSGALSCTPLTWLAPSKRISEDPSKMTETSGQQGDISLREAANWANQQAKRLAANFGFDMAKDRDMFALAQTAKLGEEVGELHAEVLGAIK